MSTTDQMKEELFQAHDILQFMVKHLKDAHGKASHCNPFVESMLYDMIKVIRDVNFELNHIRHMVDSTEIIVKKDEKSKF
jgi:hypothetical protein